MVVHLSVQQSGFKLWHSASVRLLKHAKVSIVGAGMVGQPGVAAKMFEALAKDQINIQMIATSEIKISCVVAQAEGVKAIHAIHDTFGLAGSEKIQIPA